jgi:hypothetical protein
MDLIEISQVLLPTDINGDKQVTARDLSWWMLRVVGIAAIALVLFVVIKRRLPTFVSNNIPSKIGFSSHKSVENATIEEIREMKKMLTHEMATRAEQQQIEFKNEGVSDGNNRRIS